MKANVYLKRNELFKDAMAYRKVINKQIYNNNNYNKITKQREEQNDIFKKFVFYNTIIKRLGE